MPTAFRTFGDRAIVTGHLLARLPSGRGFGQRSAQLGYIGCDQGVRASPGLAADGN